MPPSQKNFDRFLPVARKWAAVFDVPLAYVLTIARIESSFNPQASNQNDRAAPHGGAWGPMQMLETTARDLAKTFGRSPVPEVKEAMKRWHGKGVDLCDLDLGTMFGAWYLARLTLEFDTLPLVAAAYHAGPGTVRKLVAQGLDEEDLVAKLGPFSRQYVASATKTLPTYETIA